MARMTKKLIASIWEWTNTCYKQALLDSYPKVFKGKKYKAMSDRELKETLLDRELPYQSEDINNTYLKYICNLPSDQLSLVLEAHQKEKIKRAQHTIEVIMNELLERSANPETTE